MLEKYYLLYTFSWACFRRLQKKENLTPIGSKIAVCLILLALSYSTWLSCYCFFALLIFPFPFCKVEIQIFRSFIVFKLRRQIHLTVSNTNRVEVGSNKNISFKVIVNLPLQFLRKRMELSENIGQQDKTFKCGFRCSQELAESRTELLTRIQGLKQVISESNTFWIMLFCALFSLSVEPPLLNISVLCLLSLFFGTFLPTNNPPPLFFFPNSRNLVALSSLLILTCCQVFAF